MTSRYLIAGCTPWAKRIFDKTLSKLPGEWRYVSTVAELDCTVLGDSDGPTPPPFDYIFFLHWRWMVRKEITSKHKCIGFHIGQLPEQRGGTPLQWRILEGWQHGILSAFRMTDAIDDGPVLDECQIPLHGSAEECYARAMGGASHLIQNIIRGNNGYKRQLEYEPGKGKVYPRRKPEESRIPDVIFEVDKDKARSLTLTDAYDQIRCVDAEGYPRAFLVHGGLRFTFSRVVQYDGRLVCDCEITDEPPVPMPNLAKPDQAPPRLASPDQAARATLYRTEVGE